MTVDDKRLILAIDTALDDCSAALFDPAHDEVLALHTEQIGRGHAERLPGVIDIVFTRAGLGFSSVDRIAVTIGPGSFTGVRVGVAAARGYALALGVPAVGVVTLHAMAEAVRHDKPVLAVHDAKRGEVYALLLGPNGAVVRGADALAPNQLAAFVEAIEGPLDLAGSGAAIAAAALVGRAVSKRDDRSAYPIETVARLGAVSEEPVKPLYLRSADAKPPSRPFSLFAEKA